MLLVVVMVHRILLLLVRQAFQQLHVGVQVEGGPGCHHPGQHHAAAGVAGGAQVVRLLQHGWLVRGRAGGGEGHLCGARRGRVGAAASETGLLLLRKGRRRHVCCCTGGASCCESVAPLAAAAVTIWAPADEVRRRGACCWVSSGWQRCCPRRTERRAAGSPGRGSHCGQGRQQRGRGCVGRSQPPGGRRLAAALLGQGPDDQLVQGLWQARRPAAGGTSSRWAGRNSSWRAATAAPSQARRARPRTHLAPAATTAVTPPPASSPPESEDDSNEPKLWVGLAMVKGLPRPLLRTCCGGGAPGPLLGSRRCGAAAPRCTAGGEAGGGSGSSPGCSL